MSQLELLSNSAALFYIAIALLFIGLLFYIWKKMIMMTELLMPLYKQWSVTHYSVDVIVLTSS
ncbi:transmembrane protein, putative [Medicago truncatula]|uniref:Transmembrane protein, putative n=1 Tax=Medicago truncatula TaxID=3880 RepID=A0A072VL97_MEDTR|nr:transmembrane protein, putative [Medicago truncatula]